MKHESLWVTAIIPAKTDSTRLTKKNLKVINGKTLLEHTLDYAKKSKYIKDIIVSTESKEVEKICENYEGVRVYGRPEYLLKDAEVADVYVDVFQNQFHKHGHNFIKDRSTHMVAL